ncbi:glucocerebrosidase 1b [Cochliomyia hominivorax]
MIKKKIYLKFAISIFLLASVGAENTPCNLRETKEGEGVCVCTASYCDYLEDPLPEHEPQFSLVSSSKAGLRFDTSQGLFNLFKKYYVFDYDQRMHTQSKKSSSNGKYVPPRTVRLEINRDIHFRDIVGFGGAFTGTVSYLLQKLPQQLQDHVYKSFYSANGIGWNLLRMSIGGSDFDLEPWAYNELPENDRLLTNFTKLDARDEKKAEQIHRLKAVSNLKNLKIKGAAWSPPKWMKSNKAWTGYSYLKKEYYQTWADYHLKWLEIMENNDLPVWAISTGNEPMNGLLFMNFVKFMSLGWSPHKQAEWVSDHLGPTIRKSKYKDVVIFGNDDQRYTFPNWFKMMKEKREESVKYIDALGVHWYWDEIFRPSLINQTLEKMPEKLLLVTESCIGDKPWHKSAPVLGSWSRGEKYARAFLQNLQHGYNGWIDWNLLLDQNGGPNYVDNTVDAPIIVDTNNPNEILKQPMFYTMGHFSKFIPEKSIRIAAERSNVNIDTVAYLRPDGSISAVLFNSGNANVEVTVVDTVRGTIVVNLPPRSIHTLLYLQRGQLTSQDHLSLTYCYSFIFSSLKPRESEIIIFENRDYYLISDKQMKLSVKLLIISYILQQCDSLNTDCDLVKTKYGFVCKCTEDYCDYLEEPKLDTEKNWIAITSSKSGLRFLVTKGEFDSSQSVAIKDYGETSTVSENLKSFNIDALVVDNARSSLQIYGRNNRHFNSLQKLRKSFVNIDRTKTFQKIVGFGGALTGSVAYLLQNINPSLQDHVYRSYFHKDGIAYNMLRTSIGGCDFDLEPWAYNEYPKNDKHLTNFTQLDERDLLKIQQINRIKSVAQLNDLKIMAAAWSPPPWMKTNNNWTGFSSLKTDYYETWAKYHLKFLELMLSKNITIWAISTGNEPLNGVIGWLFVNFMSLGWTPRNQAIYLNDYLGPLLKKSQFKNVLIFGNDDQRYTYPAWFLKMNSSRPNSLNYLDGLAVHWYWDDIFGPQLIDTTLQLMPHKLLINTEACVGDKPWQTHGPELGSWERGEQYIRSILQDLQHNFNGWFDWNLLLNENGGPNYVNNTVDAPIIINTTNNAEFYKQPIFYVLGHFSKFITENSKRIEVKLTSPQNTIDGVGFKRSDDKIVLIIFNSAVIPQDINLNDSIRGMFTINIPPRSINTFIYM